MKRYRKRVVRGYLSIALAIALVLVVACAGYVVYKNRAGNVSAQNSTPTPSIGTSLLPVITTLPGQNNNNIPQDGIVRINALGDIMPKSVQLESVLNSGTKTYDFSSWFQEIKAVTSAGDLIMADLETTLNGKSNSVYSGTSTLMNTPTSILDALKQCGVNLLVTSNSHMLDGAMDGVKNTIDEIRAAGMSSVGSYLSLADSHKPFIKDVSGIKIAVLAYTADTNDRYAQLPADAKTYVAKYVTLANLPKMKADVLAAKAAGAEFVIANLHWGTLYSSTPTEAQKTIAQGLLDSGVDLILGNHTHSVQPIRYKNMTLSDGTVKKVLVAYSLGNFITDQTTNGKTTSTGYMVSVDIKKGTNGKVTIVDASCTPLYIYCSTDKQPNTYRILQLSKYATAATQPSDITAAAWAEMKTEWTRVKAISMDGLKIK